jgi:hypothetical protein
MARGRNKLTGDPEFEAALRDLGTWPVEGASLNGATAPDGSAERVRDDERTGSAAEGSDIAASDVMVQTYDANGEATEIPAKPAPEPMPGFEAPALDLWPMHKGRRVTEAVMTFAGQCDLLGHRADVRNAAARLSENARVAVRITGEIKSARYSAPDRHAPFKMVLAVAVDDVLLEAEGVDDENQELRERAQKLLSELGAMREQFTLEVGDSVLTSEGEVLVRESAVAWIDRLMRIINGEPEPDLAAVLGASDAGEADNDAGETGESDTGVPAETGMLDEALAEAGVR